MTVYLRRIIFAIALVAMTMLICAPPSRATETQVSEEWIFRVVLPPQWTISDAIFAYQYRGAYYLPLIELAEAFEFYVEGETARGYASGFAGQESNTYVLDAERGEIVVKGESESLSTDAILQSEEIPEDDIYVSIEVLNDLWPVEMHVELANLTVYVDAEEELSFVRRKKREDKKEITKSRWELKEQLALENFPYVENKYKWFGKPVLDFQSSYSYNMDDRTLSGSNSLAGVQQIGQFIADYSATYSYQSGKLKNPDNLRARFVRQAAQDENLFIPTLKRLEFGDISLGQRELIGNNVSGRGAVVSNAASSKTREFDRITVEGTGPPGWELELYNNNELLEFGAIEPDGEYRFEDVVLNFGNNRIRVIMYGPQGQMREEVTEYNVAGSLLSPGDFKYRLGLVDTDRPFIPLSKVEETGEQHITQNAEFSYGLNKWLTLFGSYTKVPRKAEDEKYFSGGLSFSSPIGFGEAEAYKHINGGSALDTRFVTQLMGMRLNLRNAIFSKFKSDEAGLSDSSKRLESELQMNATLPLPFVPIGLRLNVLHTELYDGTVTTEVDTSQNFTGGGLRFSHSTNSRFLNEAHDASSGDFNVSWGRGDWQSRASLSYLIHPETELSNIGGEIRFNPDNPFQAGINVNHSFDTSISAIGTQLGYDFGDFLTTFDADYRRERGWQFIVRASTSLHPYNADKEYKLSSRSRRQQAAVLGRIFLDRDNDGTFSEGDEPIEGVRLRVDEGSPLEKSDENGYVVSLLRADRKQSVRINEQTLQDPYYRAGNLGYATTGRRASMPGFEFPVVETGAIDGVVSYDPSGKAVAGMKLELVNEAGEVYMTTETAFDGYYAFEFVMPGTYTVRADPIYEVNVPPETVMVSSDELFAFGVDLFLTEPAAEENAADYENGESDEIAQISHTPAVSGTSQPAPVSPLGEGSSFTDEELSEDTVAFAAEDSIDGGRSLIDGDASGKSTVSKEKIIINDVRIGEQPGKVRLVLDVSGPASYDIQEGDGLIMLLDIENASWKTVLMHEFAYSDVLKSYFIEKGESDKVRVILKAQNAMKLAAHEFVPAQGDSGAKIIIDIEKE